MNRGIEVLQTSALPLGYAALNIMDYLFIIILFYFFSNKKSNYEFLLLVQQKAFSPYFPVNSGQARFKFLKIYSFGLRINRKCTDSVKYGFY